MVNMIMDFAGDDQPEGSNILDGPKRLMHKLKQLLSTKEKKEKEQVRSGQVYYSAKV